MRKKKKLNKVKIVVAVFIIMMIIAGAVFGRYVYNGIREAYFTSKEFYFTSDLLTLDNATYQYENWGGVDAYDINFDENSDDILDYINKMIQNSKNEKNEEKINKNEEKEEN